MNLRSLDPQPSALPTKLHPAVGALFYLISGKIVSMWQKTKDGLYKEFSFKDFREAFQFMQAVARVAEERQHHPRWQNEWNKVKIWLSTHDAGDIITNKDKELAQAIDTIAKREQSEEIVGEKTTYLTEIKVYTDGGSRGNPGPSASGYVLLDMQDELLFKGGLYLGVTTNNQAEYQALKLGLEEAFKRQAQIVHVYMDSLLVINQMKGTFKIKNRDLWPIYEAIKANISRFREVTFTHVPRELNKQADAMVNEILDSTNLDEVY